MVSRNSANSEIMKIVVPPKMTAQGVMWVCIDKANVGSSHKTNIQSFVQWRDPWSMDSYCSIHLHISSEPSLQHLMYTISNILRKLKLTRWHNRQVVVHFLGNTQIYIHYVVLSRVRSLDKLAFLNFKPNKIKVFPDVNKETQHLRQQPYLWSVEFSSNTTASLRIAFINSQSLHKHKSDVENDWPLKCANVILCAETRLTKNDPPEVF